MTVDAETLSHQKGMEDRIDKMFAGDKLAAGILAVALWLTVLFVMFAVRGFMPSAEVELVCWIGAAVPLLFNTASIIAMLKHYGQDRRTSTRHPPSRRRSLRSTASQRSV